MSRTRLLLIHVGRHKTGTTAVQKQLQTLQRPLRRRGVLVPSTGLSQQQHLLFPASCLPEHPALPPGPPPKPDALIQHLDQEWERSNAPCCLLSSEVFCELAFRQPTESQALLQQLHAITDQLRLLQVVRPLRDTTLSAIKHQLRNDHLLQRSPLSWAEHCRRKQTALDHHWSHSGHPLLTLPYSSHRIVDDLLQAVLREIGREATWATAAQTPQTGAGDETQCRRTAGSDLCRSTDPNRSAAAGRQGTYRPGPAVGTDRTTTPDLAERVF